MASSSSSSSATVIVIDDSDSRVQYGPGSWMAATSPSEHDSTAHGLAGEGSFTFAFNGTDISVLGFVSPHTNSTPVYCAVDGVNMTGPAYCTGADAEYNLSLCDLSNLTSDEEHTLVFTANGGPSTSLFFDYILYSAPPDFPQNLVPASSPANVVIDDSRLDLISYGGPSNAWAVQEANGVYEQTIHGTSIKGATATFNFQGTAVSVYGTIGNSAPGSYWDTTYTVDDGPSFVYSAVAPSNDETSNQVQFYQANDLSDGDHTLVITYSQGNAEFLLDFFTYTASSSFGIVQGQSSSLILSQTTSASVSTVSSSDVSLQSSFSQSESNSHSSNNHAPVIAGATIGSILGILAILASLFLYVRRRRRADSNDVVPIERASLHHFRSPLPAPFSPTSASPLLTPPPPARSSDPDDLRPTFSALATHPYATSPPVCASRAPPVPRSSTEQRPTHTGEPSSIWLPSRPASTTLDDATTQASLQTEVPQVPSLQRANPTRAFGTETSGSLTYVEDRRRESTLKSPTVTSPGPSSTPRSLIQHEDGGVRLDRSPASGDADSPVEELPPVYRSHHSSSGQ